MAKPLAPARWPDFRNAVASARRRGNLIAEAEFTILVGRYFHLNRNRLRGFIPALIQIAELKAALAQAHIEIKRPPPAGTNPFGLHGHGFARLKEFESLTARRTPP